MIGHYAFGRDIDVSHKSLFQKGFGATSVEKRLNYRDVSRKCALEGNFGETYSRLKIAI